MGAIDEIKKVILGGDNGGYKQGALKADAGSEDFAKVLKKRENENLTAAINPSYSTPAGSTSSLPGLLNGTLAT